MAYLAMGAISRDKINLSLSPKDASNLRTAIKARIEKKARMQDGR